MAALARRLDIGNPTSIPPKPDGIRYIHVDSRDALHQRMDSLVNFGVIAKDAPVAIAAHDMDHPLDEAAAAAAAPSRPPTPRISEDEEEPPRLRRAVAHITVDEDPYPVDPDLMQEEHSPSFFAPQP